MKAAAKFTRENPCTKVELHNCFFNPAINGYMARLLVEAKMEIGDNAPKYLVREGYAEHRSTPSADYLALTEEGEEWLTAGLARYLELHPERTFDVARAASAKPASRVIRRGVSAPQKPANKPLGRAILRRSAPR